MKLRALALSTLMVMSVLTVGVSLGPGVAAAANDAGNVSTGDLPGSGTSDDPYQISNASELQAIENDLGAHYTLVADVNASDTSEWNDGAGFAPIGDSGTPFTGTFDGNGYTIADLTINRSSENNVGLFGYTGSSAVIANVSIEDIDVTGYQYVGGLVGYSSGTMDSSYATGNVSATGNTVGGLVGYGEGTVGSSYATGNVSATGNTVGGLIGTNFGTVDSSYATGTVTGQDRVGGLIGANLGTVTDAYWDVNTTGQSDTNDGYDDAGTGLTTTQLKANTSLDGFDFTNTWAVKTGGEVSYPYLLNNTQSPAPGLESLFAGGNGTAANPYQIGDWNDLDSVRNALDANFTLVADLNSSTAGYDSVASPSANNDKGFEPIGSSSTRFNGTFNGSGYKLADLVINRPDSRNVSIFGVVGSSGTVTLTGVENASVTGGTSVGGLVGYNAGMVNLSYTTGSVSGDDSGNQSGSSVGGLVGNLTGNIRNAYSMSDVTGTTTVGGLVGNISKNVGTRTKYTYATGKVSSTVNATVRGHAGGVLEYGQQQIAYFDQKTTGVTERVGNPYPRHTGQLKGYEGQKEFFHKEYETQDVFDSQNIWTINNSDGVVSYPYLQQNPQTDIPGKEKLYPAGNGTSGQPYEVANWTHLNDTRQNPSANFTLTANLSRESGGYRKEVTNPSGGFTPINGFGSGAGSEFKGRFDGAGNTITDLVINRNSDFVGLFGISSGTISNISIKNVSISGDRGVGGVVGLQVHPELGGARTIKNVSVTGEVNGTSFVGGVAGQIYLDTVRDTNASVNVTGETAVGGLVGSSAAGKITDSNVDGRVTGGTYVGGLVGAVGTNGRFFNNRGSIQASTTDVSVTGNSSVGGMVGANGGTSIPAVYYEGKINHLPLNGTEIRALEASGSVQSPRNAGGRKIGGLVGQLYRANVTRSSATGEVQGRLNSGDVQAGNATKIGGLVGYMSGTNAVLKRSVAVGNVTGSSNVGGLVGANGNASAFKKGGTIENATASGTVTLAGDSTDPENLGGLVGQSFQGTVTQSNATGDVNGGDATNVGGLVGYNDATEPSTIRETYATGAVDGGNNVGGLVGKSVNDLVTESYAIGSVNGSASVGGLVGINTGSIAKVNNSYAAGSVTGDSAGGLVGTNGSGATVEDAYWDTETTNQSSSAGNAMGLTTSQLKANTSLAGFDFETTWAVKTGAEKSYPYLLNNTQSPAPGLGSLFAGGSGTEADPYELSSPDALGSVSLAPNASYELTADLDLAGVSHDPIGTAATPFNGSFDGNGYTIANLTIDRPGEDNVGLFGYVGTNGTVANVTIGDATVTGDSNVGGLVGETSGTITGSSVTGRITGNESVGGLAGANGVESDDTAGGTIESSTASATVTVNASATAPTQLGGLVGQNYQGTITTSNATGDVQAGDATSVGGLVGYTSGTGGSAVVNVSYATGNVTGSERLGGIAGTTINATITQTYATGGVNGSTDLGGLVGNVTGRNSEVVYAYAVGPVTGNSSVGGLVGTTTDNPRVANSYWDVETTGQDNSAGLREFSGRTTAEMTGPSVRESLGLFDFDATWDVLISNGTVSYPSLQANPQIPRPGTRTLYAAGDGTAGNPYEIENWYHLDATRENPRANYTLVADLDENTAGYDSVAAPSANGGHGFAPIGADRRGFEGEFDGEGHTIADLTIDRPGEDTVGLFAIVPAGQYADGTVKNLRLSNVDITGRTSVGGVAGFHGQAAKTIANVSVSGSVDGTEDVGGVVGTNLGLVENLTATATVNGSTNVGGLAGSNRGIVTESDAAGTVSGSTNVGGLVGANELGTVRDSNAMGDVTGDSTVGGLLGTNNGGLVTGSYATGNVTVSGDNAGGLIGWNTDYSDWSGVHNATVTNTYATGDVSAKGQNVGGLLGNNTVTDGGQSVINNSYAVGAVSGYASLGGLVGTNNATVENAYWDTETTGLSDSDGGTGLTTSQLKANTSLAFDFGTTWDVKTGSDVSYPYLLNNTQSPAPGLETIDTTSPSISTFSVTNPSDQDVQVSFDTSEQLSTIEVTISGAESATLMTGEFSETDNSDGTYTYTATHAVSTDGDYTATLTAAADAAGNDGASGESGNVTIDVTPPTIDSFAVSNPSGQDVQVAFNSTEQLSTVEVSITGAESTTLTSGDFTATASDGTYTYEAIHAGNSDGTYTATLETATDDAGNDGASSQSGSVEVDTADDGGSGGGPGAGDMSAPSISGFEVTSQSGQNVHITFVANEQVSTISVAITGAESATLATSDFSETDNGDGTYTYETTYPGSSDGTYTATLSSAEDDAGNDGASGQSGSVTVDVTAPSISGFEVSNPSEQDVRVAFDADEQLATVEVTISGAASNTLATSDFSKIDNGDGIYTYEATYEGSTDGNYTATLKTATDDLGNDGANAQSETVIVDTTAPSISGFAATNPSGQDVRVTFDADEQLSTLQVAITGPESATLATSDFSETDNGDGTYTYEATYAGSTDGTYEVSLETATDDTDNDGASGQSATVTVDTDEDDGDTTTDEDDGDTTTDEDDGDTTTDEDDGDTTTDEDDGDTTTDEDDGDTTTDEDDETTTDAERKPSGETNPGETWVEPSELQEVRIVDVRLETAPANSVKTTNIVTLENPFQTERSVDVRFVIDGDVVGEREVSVPAEQRINATQSVIVEESGTHEVAANVATKGDDGGTVRTFDFMIGTLELDDNGDELASSSADPPGQRDTDELTAEDGTDDDGGSGVSPLVVVGIIVLVALVLMGVYVRRRSGS